MMKSKSKVNSLFQKFHKIVETQYKAKIQVLRSDNGREYHNTELQQYLEAQGMIHHTTLFQHTPTKRGSRVEKLTLARGCPSFDN